MAMMKPLGQFEAARNRTRSQFRKTKQETQEALQRRAAARGGLQSGAHAKQLETSSREIGQAEAQALQNVDLQEQAERARLAEIEQQRQFAAGEAEKQRTFASGESALQRKFQQGLQEGQQKFSSGEAEKQRGFAASESALGREQQAQQFDKSYGLSQSQFELDQQTTDFNKLISMLDAGVDFNDPKFQALFQRYSPGQGGGQASATTVQPPASPVVNAIQQEQAKEQEFKQTEAGKEADALISEIRALEQRSASGDEMAAGRAAILRKKWENLTGRKYGA